MYYNCKSLVVTVQENINQQTHSNTFKYLKIIKTTILNSTHQYINWIKHLLIHNNYNIIIQQ